MTEIKPDFDPTTDMTRDEARDAAHAWAAEAQRQQIANPIKKELPTRKSSKR